MSTSRSRVAVPCPSDVTSRYPGWISDLGVEWTVWLVGRVLMWLWKVAAARGACMAGACGRHTQSEMLRIIRSVSC